MSVNFNNCDVLGYNSVNRFLGEQNLRFSTTKQLSIQGNILNVTAGITATSGISGLVSGQQAIELAANDWQNIIINGQNFGSGTFKSIEFDENTDLRRSRYNISLEIQDSGDLRNLATGTFYSGIDYTNYRYITDLSESINYINSFDQKGYQHSIDIGILTQNSGTSLSYAKTIAANLFNDADNILGVLGDYSNLGGKKQIFSEDYDMLSVRAKFGRDITLYKNTSGGYSLNKTYSYQRGTDGVVIVSEQGNIIALAEPYIDVLSTAYQAQVPYAYTNCLDVFNAYGSNENRYTLKSQPITKGTNTNRFEKTLSYEFVYSNNLNINTGFFWNYTHDSSLGDNGQIESKEDGNIVGFGLIILEKFTAAKAGYNSIKGAIESRTLVSYDRFKSFNNNLTNATIYLIDKNETYIPFNGAINYSYSYSNDRNMLTDPRLTRAEVTVNEGFRVPIAQAFSLINRNEIEQVSAAYEVAEKSIDVTINGKKTAVLSDYLSYLYSIAPSYAGDFLNNASYSYDPFANTFNGNLTWIKIFEP